MNPLASHFAPSSFAMVQYGGAVKANGPENRPHDLIMHESIKTLVHEVQKLRVEMQEVKARASSLEHDNSRLKLEITVLKQVQAHDTAAPAVQSTLCGYAASDASSTAITVDTAGLEKKVQEHQGTVTQILEKFNESLVAGTTKQEELSKQLTEIQGVLKNVKGRTGVLESKIKSVAAEVDELEVAVQEVRNDRKSVATLSQTQDTPSPPHIKVLIEKLRNKVASLDAKVQLHEVVLNDLGQDTETRLVMSEDGTACEYVDAVRRTARPGVQPPPCCQESRRGRGESGSGSRAELRSVTDQIDQLKRAESQAFEEKEKIDNCSTKDRLYELYHQYTKGIDKAKEGAYQDHLWAMRDRVIVRLAIFDLYGKALQEAKTADVDL